MLPMITRVASLAALAQCLLPPLAQGQEPPEMPHGAWVAEDVAGSGVAERTRVTLELLSNGTARGSGGCNRFTTSFDLNGYAIRFGRIVTTEIACSPVVSNQERALQGALSETTNWRFDSGKLLLVDNNGRVAARFVRQTENVTLSIQVPDALQIDRKKLSYDCAGESVEVEYFNAGTTSLATLSRAGEFTVAANVIAASGAKYAGRNLIWWTKGDQADLYDLMVDADKPIACKEQAAH